MNPLKWKREHQVALLICAAIGFSFGFICRVHELNIYGYQVTWFQGWTGGESHYGSIDFYWLAVTAVGIFGALIGSAIIYAVQLVRN